MHLAIELSIIISEVHGNFIEDQMLSQQVRKALTLVCVIILSGFVSVESTRAQDVDSTVRVFIFAGQSNMVGSDSNVEDIENFPPFRGLEATQEKVAYSYCIGRENKTKSDGWEGLHPVNNTVGPELSFARKVGQSTVGPIAIIKIAAGGTHLGGDWNPDDPSGFEMYPLALQHIRDALSEMDKAGVKYQIEGFMWHQGENDMFNEEYMKNYGENLKNFLACWRRDLECPELKFYIGELCTKTIWGMDLRPRMFAISQGQKAVTEADPNAVYVPTSHVGVEIGGGVGLHYHYGTLGQLEHGENYADAWLESNLSNSTLSHGFTKWPYPKGETVKLFVLAGHRNMEGERAFVQELESKRGLLSPQASIAYRFSIGGGVQTSNGWQALQPCGFYDTFGPEVSFGDALKAGDQNNIAIAKFTHSGSQIIDWTPEGSEATSRNLFPSFVEFIKQSVSTLEGQGNKVEIAGVFYHVGENDMSFGPYRKRAAERVAALIKQSRDDLGLPKLKWFVSQQPPTDDEQVNKIEVVSQFSDLAKTDQNLTHIKAFDLEGSEKKLVISTPGIVQLGELLAQSYLASPESEVEESPPNDQSSDQGSGLTKGIIDFQKPANATQLVGESESKLVPESKAKCQWEFKDGVLTASPKWDSVVTQNAYQDFRLHVEFSVNDAGDVPRERDGNSGIYIQQRYEIQILNSFGVPLEDFKNDDCGCIYGLKKPDMNVCKPSGEWQDFDIAFRSARYQAGKKVENARITVYQNRELIHDDVAISRKTGAGKNEKPTARPIKLQGHHNQVKFRNIWIQELKLGNGDQSKSIPKITTSQKSLPLPGESFKLNGHDAFLILPKNSRSAKEPIPWVWYAPTLPGLPADSEKWMFERFLSAGVAIAGIDVGESYGSPSGCEVYSDFYNHVVRNRNMSNKPCLLARSRGGLMLYNWAVQNPNSVSGIAGIYPVCNLASYPGIERACGAYELSAQELEAKLSDFNPIDRLRPLAEAKVPIFHIHGDVDAVVPLEKNSQLVAERYKELGAEMTLEIAEGQGHNMWTGWFQSESLVQFVLKSVGRQDLHPVPASKLWLRLTGGEGPGNGKHVVLIAAEQEYRSEQSMPMLARVLSEHHGFDCTVLFSMNDRGMVDPTLPAPFKDKTKRHKIPGIEHLAKADCVILLSRFMQLPDEQLKHLHDYFDSGKPLIALRTANHGLWGPPKYTKEGKKVGLRELLGGAFMGHHGGWHRESTKGIVVPESSEHPILTGVSDIWGPSDVYRCHDEKSPFPADATALVLGQPLVDLTQGAESNADKEPLPIAWTKTWNGNNGHDSRIFHFTMGSAKDFENEGVRRLTINAVYWGLEMEDQIDPASSVDIIGDYQPLKSGFNYEKLGVQPHEPAFYLPR